MSFCELSVLPIIAAVSSSSPSSFTNGVASYTSVHKTFMFMSAIFSLALSYRKISFRLLEKAATFINTRVLDLFFLQLLEYYEHVQSKEGKFYLQIKLQLVFGVSVQDLCCSHFYSFIFDDVCRLSQDCLQLPGNRNDQLPPGWVLSAGHGGRPEGGHAQQYDATNPSWYGAPWSSAPWGHDEARYGTKGY